MKIEVISAVTGVEVFAILNESSGKTQKEQRKSCVNVIPANAGIPYSLEEIFIVLYKYLNVLFDSGIPAFAGMTRWMIMSYFRIH